MLKTFRQWFFKQLMGMDVEHFLKFAQVLIEIDGRMKEIEVKQLIDAKVLIEISEQSGGPGWTIAMQKAVAQLDANIDKLAEVVSSHQQAFEELLEDDSDSNIKNLN